MTAIPFIPPPGSSYEGVKTFYNVTIDPVEGSTPRSFLGNLYPRSWDNIRENCMYAGNRQGGSGREFDELPGSVIEGRYADYAVDHLFGTDFEYDEIEGVCADSP